MLDRADILHFSAGGAVACVAAGLDGHVTDLRDARVLVEQRSGADEGVAGELLARREAAGCG